MKKVVLLILLGVAMVPFWATAGNSTGDRVDTASELSLVRQGWVDYKYCMGLCAALGDPSRYNVYTAGDISDSALKAIQGLGFSMNPAGVNYKFKNCLTLSEEQKDNQDANLSFFWTDYITLTKELLSSMQLKWEDLGIIPSNYQTYQIQ